ncbi:MAG TPA: alpha/beta fold hydrolase [Stellaceae bacterium]|nr:alpha/beta fold hydrolase [Stellaceae bacterium]
MDDVVRTLADLALAPFVPRSPWWGGDLQTVRNYLLPYRLPGDHVHERLVLPLSDGSGDQLTAAMSLPPRPLARAPLVILIHGLTGDEISIYMLRSAASLVRAGYPVLRLNLRGAGPSRPLSRLQYHAGRTADFEMALAALPPDLLAHGVAAVGYSLGGNMLLKFLGERGRAQPLRAAVSISAPIDLDATSRRMQRARNYGYQAYLMRQMRAEALAPKSELTERERDIVLAARSIPEFDHRFTAPRNGFSGADDYYERNGAQKFLGEIRVPTLVIHACNDPWVPAEPYLAYDWKRNPALIPMLCEGGGHVGFHGTDRSTSWHDLTIVRFLAAVFSLT